MTIFVAVGYIARGLQRTPSKRSGGSGRQNSTIFPFLFISEEPPLFGSQQNPGPPRQVRAIYGTVKEHKSIQRREECIAF